MSFLIGRFFGNNEDTTRNSHSEGSKRLGCRCGPKSERDLQKKIKELIKKNDKTFGWASTKKNRK